MTAPETDRGTAARDVLERPPPAPAPKRETPGWVKGLARWAGALAGAVVIFAVLLLAKGADPVAALGDMLVATFAGASVEQILIKAAPLVLAALAVVLPARAGLANVGGEGQVIMGAVAGAGAGLLVPGPAALPVMLVAGALGGALWAGLAAALRLTVGVNEAVTTLLLNYVALDVMLYLIYEPWKDPDGSGQPATPPLTIEQRLPLLGGTAVHAGIAIALVAAVIVWFVLRRTAFGFRLSVTGGNPEAARRAGLPVARLLLAAMLLGGALAGLAGVIHLAGVEFKLRPGLTTNIGYIAFLAAWLARHNPLPAVAAALLLAAVTVGGDSLQLDSGLPAATVNVLMALVLLAVLGWTSKRSVSACERPSAGPRSGALCERPRLDPEREYPMSDLLVDVLTGGVRGGTAIMFAALGETLSERAGVVNLGTEGCMLVGALTGYAVAAETGSPWAGLAAGAVAGGLLALVHAVMVIWRRADQFATGLTLMFLGLGLTSLFGAAYVGVAAPGFEPVRFLAEIPVLGGHDPVTYLSLLAAPLLWWWLRGTRGGLLLRTAGERADVLHVHGYRPGLIRGAAVVAGGALAGIGGAQLSTAYAHAWFEGMTAGRGFIAVALVIFAAWRPLWVLAGSYLFGAALALAPALQARGYSLNQFALDALPFVITLAILAVLGRRTLRAAPEELRRVFESASR